MTTYRRYAFAVLIGTVTILGRPTAAAEFINAIVPVEAVSFDPCTNEDVALSGTAHISGSLTVNANQSHISAHVNYNIDGIGLTSGDSYHSNANGMAGQNVEADNPFLGEATLIARAMIIGPGSLPNAFADVVGHLTVTPDGTLTAVVDEVRFSCH
jgi:hypothetical protein